MTDAEEGRFVASTIFEQKMQNQMNNGDFAILYRTNAISLYGRCAESVTFRIEFMAVLYQRKEIKDVLYYLRLVINQR
jgi:DNA helicase-2/ATP-dependent DNA helicase PcrA